MTKNIIIQDLSIKNFMGYASAKFDFSKDVNKIGGETGCGKSSIINALKFVFGLNVANYNPTINGYKVKDLTTEVSATIVVDELPYVLTVVSEQKWKTNKITEEKEFVGMDNSYTFDGIGCKKNVYIEKIETTIGCEIDRILLLLDSKYFNTDSPKWTWANRRKFLFDILGIEQTVKTLMDKPCYDLISGDLRKGKDEVDIQKMLNAEKKAICDEQTANMVKIDDRTSQINELVTIDFGELRGKQESLREEIDRLQQNISVANDNETLRLLEQRKFNLLKQLNEIKQSDLNAKCQYRWGSGKINEAIACKESEIRSLNRDLEYKNIQVAKLDIEIEKEQAKTFDDSTAVCPTCHRLYDDDKINELHLDFIKSQKERIARMTVERETLTENAQEIIDKQKVRKEELSALKAELDNIAEPIPHTAEIAELEIQIDDIDNQIANCKAGGTDTIIVKDEIKRLQAEYDNIVRELTKEQTLGRLQSEIRDLKEKSKELANKDSIRIRKANQLKDYIIEKVALVNETVNQHFDGVEFLLTKMNTALAENAFESCCSAMLNGVPYECQSNGQKIYSDICVAKGLRNLLGVNMPLLVDEKQSVTLPYQYDGQTIELYTVPDIKINATMIRQLYNESDCIK